MEVSAYWLSTFAKQGKTKDDFCVIHYKYRRQPEHKALPLQNTRAHGACGVDIFAPSIGITCTPSLMATAMENDAKRKAAAAKEAKRKTQTEAENMREIREEAAAAMSTFDLFEQKKPPPTERYRHCWSLLSEDVVAFLDHRLGEDLINMKQGVARYKHITLRLSVTHDTHKAFVELAKTIEHDIGQQLKIGCNIIHIEDRRRVDIILFEDREMVHVMEHSQSAANRSNARKNHSQFIVRLWRAFAMFLQKTPDAALQAASIRLSESSFQDLQAMLISFFKVKEGFEKDRDRKEAQASATTTVRAPKMRLLFEPNIGKCGAIHMRGSAHHLFAVLRFNHTQLQQQFDKADPMVKIQLQQQAFKPLCAKLFAGKTIVLSEWTRPKKKKPEEGLLFGLSLS